MQPTLPRPRRGDGERRSDAMYVVFGIVLGGAALYVGLVTLLVGLIPMAIAARLVWRRAGRHRVGFIGGTLMGVGLAAWPALGVAVTNHDPAVRYDPSTVPFLIAGLVVGAVGLVLTAISTVRAHAGGVA